MHYSVHELINGRGHDGRRDRDPKIGQLHIQRCKPAPKRAVLSALGVVLHMGTLLQYLGPKHRRGHVQIQVRLDRLMTLVFGHSGSGRLNCLGPSTLAGTMMDALHLSGCFGCITTNHFPLKYPFLSMLVISNRILPAVCFDSYGATGCRITLPLVSKQADVR